MLDSRSAGAWRLARRQHGVVTRSDLLGLSFTAKGIRHRVERGRLHPVGHGIYAVGRPDLTREGRWMGVVLACGWNGFPPDRRWRGPPRPETKQWVSGFEVDFFWRDLGLVVETDGWRYHRTPAAQTRDARRFQAHTAAGLTPLPLFPTGRSSTKRPTCTGSS
jgi:hypothetical protein